MEFLIPILAGGLGALIGSALQPRIARRRIERARAAGRSIELAANFRGMPYRKRWSQLGGYLLLGDQSLSWRRMGNRRDRVELVRDDVLPVALRKVGGREVWSVSPGCIVLTAKYQDSNLEFGLRPLEMQLLLEHLGISDWDTTNVR